MWWGGGDREKGEKKTFEREKERARKRVRVREEKRKRESVRERERKREMPRHCVYMYLNLYKKKCVGKYI